MRHSVCGCVVVCFFGCQKKNRKSCGFVLSLTNFEIKKKERIFRHLAYSNQVLRLHPETTRQISLRNFVTQKKIKNDLVVFLLLLLLLGGIFFFFFNFISSNGVEFSLDSLWKISFFFFPQMNKDPTIFFTHKNSVKKTNNIPR